MKWLVLVLVLGIFISACTSVSNSGQLSCSKDSNCIDPCSGKQPQMCVNSAWAAENGPKQCNATAVEWKGDCNCDLGSSTCSWQINCMKLTGDYRDRCLECAKTVDLRDYTALKDCLLA